MISGRPRIVAAAVNRVMKYIVSAAFDHGNTVGAASVSCNVLYTVVESVDHNFRGYMVQDSYPMYISPNVGIGHGCGYVGLVVHYVPVQIYVDAATGEEMPVSSLWIQCTCNMAVSSL